MSWPCPRSAVSGPRSSWSAAPSPGCSPFRRGGAAGAERDIPANAAMARRTPRTPRSGASSRRYAKHARGRALRAQRKHELTPRGPGLQGGARGRVRPRIRVRPQPRLEPPASLVHHCGLPRQGQPEGPQLCADPVEDRTAGRRLQGEASQPRQSASVRPQTGQLGGSADPGPKARPRAVHRLCHVVQGAGPEPTLLGVGVGVSDDHHGGEIRDHVQNLGGVREAHDHERGRVLLEQVPQASVRDRADQNRLAQERLQTGDALRSNDAAHRASSKCTASNRSRPASCRQASSARPALRQTPRRN